MTGEEKQIVDNKWSALVANYPTTRDECFLMVYEACKNIAKTLCRGIRNTNLEDDALDAAMYCIECMDRLGHRPEKLSSYCYLRVKKFLYLPSRIRADRELSYEEIQNVRSKQEQLYTEFDDVEQEI